MKNIISQFSQTYPMNWRLTSKCPDSMNNLVMHGSIGSFHTRSAPMGEIEEEKIPHVSKAQIRKIVREELTRLGIKIN